MNVGGRLHSSNRFETLNFCSVLIKISVTFIEFYREKLAFKFHFMQVNKMFRFKKLVLNWIWAINWSIDGQSIMNAPLKHPKTTQFWYKLKTSVRGESHLINFTLHWSKGMLIINDARCCFIHNTSIQHIYFKWNFHSEWVTSGIFHFH